MPQTEVNSANNAGMLFLGIGECMIELSDGGNGMLRKSFAGDVFNTLWYFEQTRDKAWRTSFFSALGDDPLSGEMRKFMVSASISDDHVATIKGKRPGLYMIHLDKGERSFSYWRNDSAAKQLASDRPYLRNALCGADLIYLSGITLAILSIGDLATLAAELHSAKAKGKLIAFDPNIRPALWDNPERMKDAIAHFGGLADFVFPGFDDDAAHFGDKTLQDTITRYQMAGAKHVIVKNGAKEVLVGAAGETMTFKTPPVDTIVDTTAAGDSFNGAFLASYLNKPDFPAAVKAGQQCAAKVISRHGALIKLD